MGSKCVAMPNLVEIGQTAAEIWRFSIFQDGGRRHLKFIVFEILTVVTPTYLLSSYPPFMALNGL